MERVLRTFLVTIERDRFPTRPQYSTRDKGGWCREVVESFTYSLSARNHDHALEIAKGHAAILYGSRGNFMIEVRESPFCSWLQEMLG